MRGLSASILLLCACAGCHHYTQPFVSADRLDRGLVIVLPGIEGRSPLNEAICRGLDEGAVDCAIELVDWTSWYGPLYNLGAQGRNRRKAAEIADRILRYKMDYPGRPVLLVGQSGGGAIAVWVAEALPPDHNIDGIVVLSASLSPNYQLDVALSTSRRGMISFYSNRDWVLLGVGTTVAGTMDGEHTSSAGKVGFEVPPGANGTSVYSRLFQVAWHREMAATGNTGLHLTGGASEFVAEYVAPFVRSAKWDEGLVRQVLDHQWHQTTEPASLPSSSPLHLPARTQPAPTTRR